MSLFDLKTHLKSGCNAGKTRTCEICHQVFKTHTSLKKHLRTGHGATTKICHVRSCGKKFKNPAHYVQHNRRSLHNHKTIQVPKPSDENTDNSNNEILEEVEMDVANEGNNDLADINNFDTIQGNVMDPLESSAQEGNEVIEAIQVDDEHSVENPKTLVLWQ